MFWDALGIKEMANVLKIAQEDAGAIVLINRGVFTLAISSITKKIEGYWSATNIEDFLD